MADRKPGESQQVQVRRSISLGTSQWIVVDAALWATMFVAALWMRYDFSVDELAQSLGSERFYMVLAALIVLSCAIGWLTGLYRGRFVPGSVLESSVLTFVFATASVIVFLGHLAGGQYEGVPRSNPIVAGAFTTLSALALRSLVRRKRLFGAGAPQDAERALVFGAGDGGLQLVRQLRRSEVSHFNPVGILDDDPSKRQMLIEGVRVYGGREKLESLALKTGSTTLLLAVPSLAADELLAIRDRAEAIGLQVLTLPPLDGLMRGRVEVNELREIKVDDLLGRKPARLNQTQIAQFIRGKRVLVTGAGGSIGSELCRQLSRFRPSELMMLDRDESGLHAVQLSITDQAMLDGDDTILASIRDRDSLMRIFEERRPELVFHAAALKHMPLLEKYPAEALKTNVLGTINVLDAAEASGCRVVVNISTDKAANPCSVLGHGKRIAERLTAEKAISAPNTKFVSVRFGNVLGSRGSVLTVFEKQIKDGGPVTVTDPDVDRYFMTIPEACQLVLQAAAVGATGETLVLDMGEPIKIAEVARMLIEQAGKPIEIVFTGLRNNEKMSEDLFDSTEFPRRGDKHSALSQVSVPPIQVDRLELKEITEQEGARKWLAANSHP